jgi:hypothetical protein
MTAQFTYGGRNRVPGITAAVETFENEFLWGPYEAQYISGLTIAGTARDTGNTGSTHILRAGLLLGQNFTTKKLQQWTPTATDGTEYIWGVLKESRTMLSQNSDTDRLTGLIVVGGGVLSNRLIVPGTTAPGISGNALEYLVRQQMRANFMLNDSYMFSRPEFMVRTVSAAEQTAGITLTVADSHTAFHNTGGTVTITLPATAYKGVKYQFYAQVSTTDEVTVASGSSNILVPGASAASSLSVDGAYKEVVGDGTNWVVKAL